MSQKTIMTNLRNIIAAQIDAVDEVLKDGAQAIKTQAQLRAPSDTGELKSAARVDVLTDSQVTKSARAKAYYSFRLERTPTTGRVGAFFVKNGYRVTFGKEDFVGFFQEFGTINNAPQPFIRPAFEQLGPNILKTAVERAKRILEERQSNVA